MMKKISRMTATALILALLITGTVLAQSSAQFDLHWSLLSGGGGVRQSANAVIQDISGQTAPGISSSANVQIAAGFFGPQTPLDSDTGGLIKVLLPFIAR